jgi:putative flavoprotein involved in K+ transport
VPLSTHTDVVVIGGGQAGLSVAYFLKRTGRSFVVLDAEDGPGAAWRRGWPSLRLFSPAQASSLSGWPMPPAQEGFPTRDEVIDYLARYEQRYDIPVERPVLVRSVSASATHLHVRAADRAWKARAVVSATGTWRAPFIPHVPGRDQFAGRQLHSAHYAGPETFAGQRVLIVGGGNSGAQILAEVSTTADTCWSTERPPRFLADDVDGRVLFEQASTQWAAKQAGRPLPPSPGGLGDIVMVPPVVEARTRGVLVAHGPVRRFSAHGAVWPDGTTREFDAVIWCTGFRPALTHLDDLQLQDDSGRIAVDGTRCVREPRLWLVGYGDWTGYASATLIGVGRTARATVEQVQAALD